MADALEKIVLSEEPKAGISSSMRKAVTQFLAEATLRTVASEGNGCLTSPLLYDSKECAELTNLLDKKALPFLSKWVRIEMNKFGGEVVELFKKKLKYSQVGKERELLEHLGTAAQPLSLISDHIDAEIKEEAALDSEIEKWTKVRAAETEACKMEMGEVSVLFHSCLGQLTQCLMCGIPIFRFKLIFHFDFAFLGHMFDDE